MNASATSVSCFSVAGTTLATLLLVTSAGAQTHRVERHFATADKPVVTVQNAGGHIQVKAWDKHEVMVVAQHSGSNVEIDTEQAGNRIEIATRTNGTNTGADALTADYEITVPVETELQVRTDSGNVTVDSVHGDMSFDTVAADVALQDVEGYLMI